jgi:hypothetical protein
MLIAALGLLLAALPATDPDLAQLNSPIYAVREKARDALRASFTPTDRTRWDALTTHLQQQKGATFPTVLAVCAGEGVSLPNFLTDLPPNFIGRYRLDACWMLQCDFRDDGLASVQLLERPRIIPQPPPANYTGLWRTYRENGALASQLYYSKGIRMGPLVDSPIYPTRANSPPAPDTIEPVIEYDPGQ